MSRMNIPFEIGGKTFSISPYTTAQEKEILLASSFEVNDVEKIFDILNFKPEVELTDDEKKAILYKFREVSLGDEIDIKFVCDACGQGNDGILEASNFVKPGKRNDPDIKKIVQTFTEDKMHEYVDIDVDDLDIDEYEKLKQRIIDNQIEIDFIKECKCLKCGTHKKFDMSDTKYIIDVMSEDTLMTLYKSYNFLIFFGKYTKLDIDSMYPFERSIFIGLLNKTKEDLNK